MLKRLYISNFALIGEMDVSFPGGLTVITGETGAGKSIFLEALGLVLGNRADLSALKNKDKKCIVEAEFKDQEQHLTSFFEENDLDYDTELILRREINSDGKSRCFINDSVVNLSILKSLSEHLIDIHSQHQTLLLNASDFQMELVDAFAGSLELFTDYKKEYASLQSLKTRLKTLTEQEQQSKKELDYYQFLSGEFEEANLQPGQLAQLEEESLSLENAEGIKTALRGAADLLQSGDQNMLSALVQLRQLIAGISKYNKQYQEFFDRVQSAYLDLKELASELERAEGNVQFDNQRLDDINGRLDRLNRLLNKHHVKTEEELLGIKQDIDAKLQGYGSLETQIEKTKKEIKAMEASCLSKAKVISQKRHASVDVVQKQVKELLAQLSMQNATFTISLKTAEEAGPGGLDQVRFLFSANKGMDANDLSKVASGGELSRVMLSLKSLLATKKKLPAIVFDEIDTGVSGEVADKIGRILNGMSKHLQVITITHLPQMASKGKHHLFVYKKEDADKTNSYIRQLQEEDRVMEIAKMLSAGKPGSSAIENARELLKETKR